MIDKYGQKWKKINKHQVKRLSDGMIGNWYNGQGLFLQQIHPKKPRKSPKEKKNYKMIEEMINPIL